MPPKTKINKFTGQSKQFAFHNIFMLYLEPK